MEKLDLYMHRANGDRQLIADGVSRFAAKLLAREVMNAAMDTARQHETRYDDDGLLPVCVVMWSGEIVVGVVTCSAFIAAN